MGSLLFVCTALSQPTTTPSLIQAEQAYPEAGISTPPDFTKYEQLSEDNLDEWVENGFGEFDDVDERCVDAEPCVSCSWP